MKKIKFFAMALAAVAMFSCAKENNPILDEELKGEPVDVQFNISFPSNATSKAITPGTSTGTAAEQAVATVGGGNQDIVVYVISNGRVEAVVNAASTTGNKTAVAKITTGKKQILAIVNGGAAKVLTFAVDAKLTDIQAAALTATTNAYSATTATPAVLTNLLFTSKLMSVDVTKGSTSTTAQQIAISVERALAKVIVRDNIAFKLGVPATQPTAAQFTLNGQVSGAYLYQHLGSDGAAVNPTGLTWAWRNTPATTTPSALKYYGMAAKDADIATIDGLGTTGGLYTLEGVVASKSPNNASTQILVKVNILPTAKFTLADNTVGADIKDTENYIVVKHKTIAGNYLFFATDDIFKAWSTDTKNKATYDNYDITHSVMYTKGENYYYVKIHHDDAAPALKFSVLRNCIYNVQLNNVNAFGGNENSTIVTPDDPLETDAFIEATITLLPWNVKTQESDLE
ncbi:MAG: Mfa1 family fimbria major subunit [Mucinivorans sp.]